MYRAEHDSILRLRGCKSARTVTRQVNEHQQRDIAAADKCSRSFNFCPLPKTTGTLRRAGDYTKFTSYNRYFNMLSSFENVETLVVHIAIINNSEFMRRIGMCKKVLLPQVKTLKTCVSGASLLRHCPNIENIVLFDENHRSKFQFHPWLSALATTTTLQSLQMCTITPENLYGMFADSNTKIVPRTHLLSRSSSPCQSEHRTTPSLH